MQVETVLTKIDSFPRSERKEGRYEDKERRVMCLCVTFTNLTLYFQWVEFVRLRVGGDEVEESTKEKKSFKCLWLPV